MRQLLIKDSGDFAKSETDLGCTNVTEHKITFLDEAPVQQHYGKYHKVSLKKSKCIIRAYLGKVAVCTALPWLQYRRRLSL